MVRNRKTSKWFILVMKSQNGWTNSDKHKEEILDMLKWVPDITIKIATI